MDYSKSKLPRLVLLLTFIAVIAITAVSIITVNAVNQNWGFYEIFSAIGATFIILGGLGVITLYNATTRASTSTYVATMYPDIAFIDAKYARAKKYAFPIISITLMVIGAIFLAIGLIGIF